MVSKWVVDGLWEKMQKGYFMETCDRGLSHGGFLTGVGVGGLILGTQLSTLVQFEKSLICMLKFVESTFANCDSVSRLRRWLLAGK